MENVVTALTDAVGSGRVSIESKDLAAHARDAWPAAVKWTAAELEVHLPLCVVRPRTASEVSAVVRAANALRKPIVPYGAGSGVVGAAIPTGSAISLDTRDLNRIVEVDEENWLVTVEAGALGSDVEQRLNTRSFTLGHYPQSLFVSTVGGWVATRATGTFSSKYGGIEDILYALQAVLPTGEIVQTRNVARSSVGPRLFDLFLGSEGVFGIITQATLKIQPLPEARRFRGITMPSVHDGLRAVRELYRQHLIPALIRLYEEQEASVLYQAVGLKIQRALLLTGVEGQAGLALAQEQQVLETCRRHGGEDIGPDIGNCWEKHRFNAEWLERGNTGEGKMADAIDVATSWKNLPVLYDRMMERLRPLVSVLWAHYSHFTAHGGSIYFIFFIDAPDRASATQRYQAAWDAAMEIVFSVGGSISHHHGVGLLRQPYLERELGTEITLLRKIKKALDPDGLMNPGKLLL